MRHSLLRYGGMSSNDAFDDWQQQVDYSWLLDPLSTQRFEEDYYQRSCCLVAREQPDYYQTVLSTDNLDSILGTHATKYPEVSLVRGDDSIDASVYTNSSGTIDPLQVVKQFDDGATIVFQGLHRSVPALAHICAVVGRHFTSRIQANAYLTPTNAQGFRPHWDTHDVFVMQIFGRKRWVTYESPLRLPLRGQKCNPDIDQPGPVLQEFELGPGDLVYLPRGLMHAAHSTDKFSLHVTLGLLGFTWADWLTECVAAAALEDVTLRQHLPIGFAGPDFPADQRQKLMREKLLILEENLASQRVWEHFSNEVVSTNKPVFKDLLKNRFEPFSVELESVVRRQLEVLTYVLPATGQCVMRFCGQELILPAGVQVVADYIANTNDGFKVQDLPDCLDSEGKLRLVKRLVVEGVLKIC